MIVVRGLQTRVAMHSAWWADEAGGSVHVLVNNGRESSALLAGLPHGPRGTYVVSTGDQPGPGVRCPGAHGFPKRGSYSTGLAPVV